MSRRVPAHGTLWNVCGRIVLLAACWGGGLVGSAAAIQIPDVQVEEVGNEVRAWLAHADEFVSSGQWPDAVETLRRVMESSGDRLIEATVDPQWQASGFSAFVPLRIYCQMRLAGWHHRAPEALEIYRRQVDVLAARLYQEAVDRRSAAQLQRIVDELLLSSIGDQALWLLGDLALEQGNYTLARRSWESIHPQLRVFPAAARVLRSAAGCSWWTALGRHDRDTPWGALTEALAATGEPVPWLAYPDSEIPLADVRTRLALVSLLEGSLDRARLETELVRRLHPDASGQLGGRTGRLVDLLDQLVQDAEQWPGPPRPHGWLTFAGCPARNGVAQPGVDIALRPLWRASWPRLTEEHDRIGRGQLRVAEAADGLLSYHVAVEQGVVWWCQSDVIRALRLSDGEPVWSGSAARDARQETAAGTVFRVEGGRQELLPGLIARAGVPRWSLTLDQGRLFARLGAAWIGGGDELVRREDDRSFLVGLDIATQKLLFDRIVPGEPGWEFESAPLARGARLFASLRRRNPATTQVKVVCFSVESGRLIWEREVVRGAAAGDTLVEWPNCPLALSDETIYCNTNLGAVVALRAADGQVEWLCRYRRSLRRDDALEVSARHAFRDLNPCLVDRGCVYVAPADSDRVLALDAGFGQVLWQTGAEVAASAVHLLGVAHGQLLASGDYLQWIDASTGQVRGQFPAPQGSVVGHPPPHPRGFGRGLLAGHEVVWPTRDRIYVFDVRSRQLVRQPLDLSVLGIGGGHLVVDSGILLIATADELIALDATEDGVQQAHGAAVRTE